MDIPFEETLRRHHTKPNAHEFGEAEMRRWWNPLDLCHVPVEQIITAESTPEQSVQRILADIGLAR